MDREGLIDADVERVFAKQPRADGVKGARPGERIGHHTGPGSENPRGDPLDAALHLGGGAPREREQHDAARIDARHDQVGDAIGERVGLAGARAGNDEQRRNVVESAAAMLDRAALLRIEFREIGGAHRSAFPADAAVRIEKVLLPRRIPALASN